MTCICIYISPTKDIFWSNNFYIYTDMKFQPLYNFKELVILGCFPYFIQRWIHYKYLRFELTPVDFLIDLSYDTILNVYNQYVYYIYIYIYMIDMIVYSS